MKKAVLLLGMVLLPAMVFAQYWGANPLLNGTPAARAVNDKSAAIAAALEKENFSSVKRGADLAAMKAELHQKVLEAVRAAAPEAQQIVNLGRIARWQRYDEVESEPRNTTTDYYYIAVVNGDKLNFYEAKLILNSTEKLTHISVSAFGYSLPYSEENLALSRNQLVKLGERFAALGGHKEFAENLRFVASRYPLASVTDMDNYQVSSETKDHISATVDLKLADGKTKSVNLSIRKPFSNSFYGSTSWLINM